MAKSQYSGPWRKIRLQILDRDGYLCQIKSPGCTGTATQVDHIIPASQNGAWFDPANLRASCANCNNQRVDRTHNEAWRTARPRIALVIGPSCAGKTTFVQENKGEHDLVIDYDAIATALGRNPNRDGVLNPHPTDALHDATMIARNALLNAIRKGKINTGRIWIISANPKAEEIFPFHTLKVIDPGRLETINRARHAGRSEASKDLILNWYAVRAGETISKSSRDW
jgi:hypothetical protein